MRRLTAEEAGFEPAMLKIHIRLASERLKPLSHSSLVGKNFFAYINLTYLYGTLI